MRVVLYMTVVLVAITIQTTTYHYPGFSNVGPDFILALTLYFSWRYGAVSGAGAGLALGFLQDILSFQALGLFSFSKAVIGYIVGSLHENYLNEMPVTIFTVTLGATLVDAAIYGVLTMTFFEYNIFGPIISGLFPLTIYNIAITFGVFAVLDRLGPMVDPSEDKDRYRYIDKF